MVITIPPAVQVHCCTSVSEISTPTAGVREITHYCYTNKHIFFLDIFLFSVQEHFTVCHVLNLEFCSDFCIRNCSWMLKSQMADSVKVL